MVIFWFFLTFILAELKYYIFNPFQVMRPIFSLHHDSTLKGTVKIFPTVINNM